MEYQAVVMAAGRGSRMTDLVDPKKPKCLLPIGNRPMIWYSLKLLEKTGFEEAIVIVHDQYKAEVATIPMKYGLKIKLDIIGVTKSEDSGTVDSLRYLKDKIKSDVLILSSDLVSDVKLQNVFDMHRTHGSSFTAVFNPTSSDFAAVPVPGPKTKPKQERDLIGLDIQTSRLVFFSSEADLISENENDQQLYIRKSVMKYFPHISMHSDLTDAHIYVMKKWVVDYTIDNKSFVMLKGDVLPHLVQMQFKKLEKQKPDRELPNPDASIASFNPQSKDISGFVCDTKEEEIIQNYSVWNDHVGDLRGPYQNQSIRCFAYIPKECFCMRANTLSSYCELNRQIIKRWSAMFPDQEVTPPSTKAQIGADCLIGESSQLSDKCSVKHSVIGQSCNIGEKVRIANCIIMDNVTIREGTSLQGSVLMDNVIVGARCDIKDCLIGNGQTTPESWNSSNQILVDEDRLLAI